MKKAKNSIKIKAQFVEKIETNEELMLISGGKTATEKIEINLILCHRTVNQCKPTQK